MLDVCLLGTGGMMPLPYRWLTSLMVRYNGSSLLIDCGEGTQIAIKEKGWSFKPIDVICFTHFFGVFFIFSFFFLAFLLLFYWFWGAVLVIFTVSATFCEASGIML